ncbi:hypothetical protein H4R22_003915, partial [Coemansia sp. RSA 1290]
MHTIHFAYLLVASAAAEMYFNVPAGVDRNAVQAAFLDHGIQGYNPAAQPNTNGLYPASFNSAQRPHTQQQQPPPMPQQPEPQPQHMPPQPAAPPQQPAMLRGPAVPANKPVAVPLAPAHGPGGVGVQSMANAESKGQREVSAVNDDGSDDDSDDKLQTAHGKVTQAATSSAAPAAQTPVGPEMAVKSASASVAANLPAMAVVPPRNILTSTVVAMSTVTGVAPAATSKVAALAAAPAAPIAPIAPAAPAAAKDVIIADEEEIIEEEEIEDDASDYASDNPLAPKLIPPMPTSTIVASETTPVVKEKPLMLAKAGVTAFKPADLDKFSFPTSEAARILLGFDLPLNTVQKCVLHIPPPTEAATDTTGVTVSVTDNIWDEATVNGYTKRLDAERVAEANVTKENGAVVDITSACANANNHKLSVFVDTTSSMLTFNSLQSGSSDVFVL